MARRKIVIPPGVWQDCRRPHRGKPARCSGTYEDQPCHHPWMVRIVAGRKPDGSLFRPSRSVDTLQDAIELVNEIAETTPLDGQYDPDITLGNWLKAWMRMKESQADSLSPATLRGYKSVIKILQSDVLLRAKVRNINYGHVNAALGRLGQPRSRPPLRDFVDTTGRKRKRAERHGKFVEQRSAGTLRGYQRVLCAAFNDAAKFKLYKGDNPAEGTMTAIGDAKAAKVKSFDRTVPLTQRMRLERWTPSETAEFLNHISQERLSTLWHLYATIGPRRGELLGVGWFSYEHNVIALESRLLAVGGYRCTECPLEHKGMVWQPGGKSENATRIVYLPTQLIAAITAHKARQDAERQARLDAGQTWWEHQLMFCEPNGTPIHPDKITKQFKRLVAEIGLPEIKLHDLRHNAASLLIARGMPIHSVAKLTGHDIPTLERIYHHVVGEVVTPEIQSAADWLEALQGGTEIAAEASVPAIHLARQGRAS